MQTEEGRAIKSGGNWNYEYTLTDHLGNSRVSFDQNSASTARQTDDYYPFGLRINGAVVSSPKNKYLYNKKELQDETGQYDYGARFYDPVVGRWGSVDPSAENDASYSPYNYGFDNSVRFTDPDGRWPDWGDIKAAARSFANHIDKALDNAAAVLVNPSNLGHAIDRTIDSKGANIKDALVRGVAHSVAKFATGDNKAKSAVVGTVASEMVLLGGGDIAKVGDVAKLGEFAKTGELTEVAKAANTIEAVGKSPSFVVNSSGQAVAIPKGATGPSMPLRGTGMVYDGGSGGFGMDQKVSGVRIMDANANQGRRVNYINNQGQTVNPFTGRTVPRTDPSSHLPYKP